MSFLIRRCANIKKLIVLATFFEDFHIDKFFSFAKRCNELEPSASTQFSANRNSTGNILYHFFTDVKLVSF